LERLRDLNQNSDRVTTKLYEARRELRECEKLHDELHDRIRDEIGKSRLQATAHYEKEHLALCRAKEAVNDFFSVIEKIVAQYPVILDILSKNRSDPLHPTDDPTDHFRERHLWMFFATMEEKFLNADDDLSSMADFLRAANPKVLFANDTDMANHYLEVVRILKSKGTEMVSVENMMAINIIRHLSLEKRAEFLKQRQIKRDLQRGSNGSDHGSVVGEGSWMEQVIHYLDQLESFNQQEGFLMLAGTSKEAAPRRTPQSADLRREETALRQNHSQVLYLNDAESVRGRGICRDFVRGICSYGDQCRWSHDVKGAQRVDDRQGAQRVDNRQGAQRMDDRQEALRVADRQEEQRMDDRQEEQRVAYKQDLWGGNPQGNHGTSVGASDRGVEVARHAAGAGGGKGGSPKIPPANQAGLIGWTKLPPRTMWDNDGWTCCFRSPYFIAGPEGPCANVLTCPYSHWMPVHAVKPANASR
jgi:hypothetical protein